MENFDALEMKIDTQKGGTYLIEASAGTGKTFGIASLFTRLILLENIKIEKIAVLTFTKAATAELKTRLRSRLVAVRSFLENNQQTEDKFLQDLFAKAQEIDKTELLKRTKIALNDFDQAGIYTIHAFCRSILNENAFDCGVPFALEMQSMDDDNELKQTLTDDFWRKYIANNKTAALICFNEKITPEKILNEIKSYISQPLLNKENISFEQCIQEVEKAQEKLFRLPEIKVDDILLTEIQQHFNNEKDLSLWQSLKQRILTLGTNEIEIKFWQI
ncbi:MAG: UvrD-helicase domain-containing protein, partial [Neisseriaceae bacterium]|nr:UvrD-helicase domain-containing protein [Neisseriaceae bacterium]